MILVETSVFHNQMINETQLKLKKNDKKLKSTRENIKGQEITTQSPIVSNRRFICVDFGRTGLPERMLAAWSRPRSIMLYGWFQLLRRRLARERGNVNKRLSFRLTPSLVSSMSAFQRKLNTISNF